MSVLDFKTIVPWSNICIDIETCHASEESILLELEYWKPTATWTEATVIKRKAEKEKSLRDKSACIDSSPIGSIGICDESGTALVFHWLNVADNSINGIQTIKADNEKGMLMAFRKWADSHTDKQTDVIGFNLNFDLPHLRIGYTRHGLKLPAFLIPQGRYPKDVMWIFTKNFSSKDAAFISLDEVAKRLGIAPEGKQLKGADVPNYIKKGFNDGADNLHLDVIIYNAIDTLLTMRAYLICTGQAGE